MVRIWGYVAKSSALKYPIDFVRLQKVQRRLRVTDEKDCHTRDGDGAFPVIRIGLQLDAVAAQPAFDAVRARSERHAVECRMVEIGKLR